MQWGCSSFVHGIDSTESHPIFIPEPGSSFPYSLPPLPCISISPHFPLLFSCCSVTRATGDSEMLLPSNAWQYPTSSNRARWRETFQSVNKALLLPSNQPGPPFLPPTSSLRYPKKNGLWKYMVKYMPIMCDYYGFCCDYGHLVGWLTHCKNELVCSFLLAYIHTCLGVCGNNWPATLILLC